MRTLWLLGIACLLGACGGDKSDGEPSDAELIRTTEVCKVDADCKQDPHRVSCRDSNTAVRYEIPTCGSDQRCAWGKLEQHCDVRCEDGYCLSAAGR